METVTFSYSLRRQQRINNVKILELIISTLIKWFLNKHLKKKLATWRKNKALYNNFVNEWVSCFSGQRNDHFFFTYFNF